MTDEKTGLLKGTGTRPLDAPPTPTLTWMQKWRALSIHLKMLALFSLTLGIATLIFGILSLFPTAVAFAIPVAGFVCFISSVCLFFLARAHRPSVREGNKVSSTHMLVKIAKACLQQDGKKPQKEGYYDEGSDSVVVDPASKDGGKYIQIPRKSSYFYQVLSFTVGFIALFMGSYILGAVTNPNQQPFMQPLIEALTSPLSPFVGEAFIVSAALFTFVVAALHFLHAEFQPPSKLGNAWRKVPLPGRISAAISVFALTALSLTANYIAAFNGSMSAGFFNAQIAAGVVSWPFVIFGAVLAAGILIAHVIHIGWHYKKLGKEAAPGGNEMGLGNVEEHGPGNDAPPSDNARSNASPFTASNDARAADDHASAGAAAGGTGGEDDAASVDSWANDLPRSAGPAAEPETLAAPQTHNPLPGTFKKKSALLNLCSQPGATLLQIEAALKTAPPGALTYQNGKGYTCLHYACANGHHDIVGVLMGKIKELYPEEEQAQNFIYRETVSGSGITPCSLADELDDESIRRSTLGALLGVNPSSISPRSLAASGGPAAGGGSSPPLPPLGVVAHAATPAGSGALGAVRADTHAPAATTKP